MSVIADRNRELGELARSGDFEARQALIVENIPLGRKMARRVARKFLSRFDEQDLVSLAAFGLIHAADHFDPDRRAFSTYASRCVIGFCFQQLGGEYGLVRVPRDYYWAEAADDQVAAAKASQAWGDVSTVADTRDPALIAEEAEERELRQAKAEDLLSRLSERERGIVSQFFGLGDGERLGVQEIADREGVSKQCIHQLLKRAIGRLQGLSGEAAKKRPLARPTREPIDAAFVRHLWSTHPKPSGAKVAKLYRERRGQPISENTVLGIIRSSGLAAQAPHH